MAPGDLEPDCGKSPNSGGSVWAARCEGGVRATMRPQVPLALPGAPVPCGLGAGGRCWNSTTSHRRAHSFGSWRKVPWDGMRDAPPPVDVPSEDSRPQPVPTRCVLTAMRSCLRTCQASCLNSGSSGSCCLALLAFAAVPVPRLPLRPPPRPVRSWWSNAPFPGGQTPQRGCFAGMPPASVPPTSFPASTSGKAAPSPPGCPHHPG